MEKYCNECIYWDSEFVPCPITEGIRHAYQKACVYYMTAEEVEKKIKITFENLKPCPFCGRKVKFEKDAFNTKQYNIVCENCHAGMGVCGDIEQAVEVWNRRVSDV